LIVIGDPPEAVVALWIVSEAASAPAVTLIVNTRVALVVMALPAVTE
jgi:hypothetical protein